MSSFLGISDVPNVVLADENRSRPSSAKTTAGLDLEKEPTSDTQRVDVSPDGGYGWVCVACVFWINAHTWGINSCYGVFLAYYLDNNYYPSVPPLEFAFVGGLSISQALLVSPLATHTTRLYGTRVTLLIGTLLETLALIGASFSHKIWHLFLSQGLCFGYGMGFLFVGSVGIVPQWFSTRRSLANGLATAGSGLGGMMYSLAINAMIEKVGIGWAFRIMGGLACSVNFICAMLIRDRNKVIEPTQLAFDYALFKRIEVLLVFGWGFLSMLGYFALLFSLPDYALSVGLSSHQGSILAALLNLWQCFGRPVVGFYSDVVGRINIAGVSTFLCGFLCLVFWIFAKSFGILIFFAVIVGPIAGIYWTTVGPVTAEVVGLRELPSALSLTFLVLVIPTTFSEAVALQLRKNSGNVYLHAQIFSGSMYIGASLCMWALRVWKIGDIERMAAEQGKAPEEIPAVSNEPSTAGISAFSRSSVSQSGVTKRLFQLKKV